MLLASTFPFVAQPVVFARVTGSRVTIRCLSMDGGQWRRNGICNENAIAQYIVITNNVGHQMANNMVALNANSHCR